jgi:uracil-DNA glycosylase
MPRHADSLLDPAALAARRALLAQAPHMAGMRGLAAGLRARLPQPVPDPDPLDGGDRARLLLLLETPGPRIMQTGFVSRDNAGGTSGNLRRFLDGAGLARSDVVIWNVVPWVIHAGGPNRAPTRAEVAAGLALLPALLRTLPALRVVVLSGRPAAQAEAPLRTLRPNLPVLLMPHPSPTYVNTSPAVPQRLADTLAAAAELLRG